MFMCCYNHVSCSRKCCFHVCMFMCCVLLVSCLVFQTVLSFMFLCCVFVIAPCLFVAITTFGVPNRSVIGIQGLESESVKKNSDSFRI